jgi:hypothetical protein
MTWIDQYTGKAYGIATEGYSGTRTTARVKTYGDVLDDYEYHPESKCADASGNICGKQTIGLLYRRHIEINRIVYIGKESNRLEEVESGMIQNEDEVYTEYPDPHRDEWVTKLLPKLNAMTLAQAIRVTGYARRTVIDWRAGRSRPHAKTCAKLKVVFDSLDDRAAKERGQKILSSIAHLVKLFERLVVND